MKKEEPQQYIFPNDTSRLASLVKTSYTLKLETLAGKVISQSGLQLTSLLWGQPSALYTPAPTIPAQRMDRACGAHRRAYAGNNNRRCCKHFTGAVTAAVPIGGRHTHFPSVGNSYHCEAAFRLSDSLTTTIPSQWASQYGCSAAPVYECRGCLQR